MAIWPFGRKSKRHTVQLDTEAAGEVVLPHDIRHSFDEGKISRKPSRKQSKRRKNRQSLPVGDYPSNLRDVPSPPPTTSTHYTPSAAQSEKPRPVKPISHSYTAPNLDSQAITRKPSLRKPQRNESPAVLKKRLSKRKAYEIAREREIRMMASMPIDIPRRSTTPAYGDPMQLDSRRTNSALSRRLDRHRSDISLSIQESPHSSISDFSETYTFKVNGFAAWTPRPVIRYVEAPRTSYSRNNQRTPESVDRRTKSPTLEASEENLRSKQRIDELADDLDAGALRELMERDRRRRERKELQDHEKLVRKLQRNAKKVPKAGAVPDTPAQDVQDETQNIADTERGRSDPQNQPETQPTPRETEVFLSGEPECSWLRGTSRGPGRDGRETPESVHVVGNIDDSSIRELKSSQRLSFGPSQDMAMSRSTLSASLSPSRHGLSSQDSSQFYRMNRESASDISRTVDSERRLSDASGGRVSTITSIFRRGSSRLKRSYRERFPDRSPPLNNVSNESFFKVNTQTQPPAPYVPPKVLLGPSSFKRSQSKFTEHFGDEPLSPPDSRLQSPDIPEDEALAEDQVPDLNSRSYYPIPGAGTDGRNTKHDSWTGGSEDDPENLPLSQSLASIDSEGSWMSGQFLRRISQKPSNSARQSLNSSRYKTDDGRDKLSKTDENSSDSKSIAYGALPGEASGEISNPTDDKDGDLVTPHQPGHLEETWHEDIGKRPVLVNPTVRPKSTQGLLNNIQSLSPSSAEEFSPIEEHSVEILFSPAHDSVTKPQAHAQ
ncbi:hypothetical protein BJX66DRAFT_139850 [Aspergillus keveii]|jgi:hypothetical protein|uniref:Uncharacterized protein n=1 Tax=Aspergillus keveii TaxID=714993 RepID=A0ABR4GBB8_9EURO